jgi:hypothetical protein
MAKSDRLKKLIEEKTRDIPRLFLRQLIKKKLRETEIEDDSMLDALTDHLLSRDTNDFIWGDDTSGLKSIKIRFSKNDGDDLFGDINYFLQNGLSQAILNSIEHGAKLIVKKLQGRWVEYKIEDRNDMQRFRDRLDLRWAAGLDPLRMMIGASREVGEQFAERLSRSRAHKDIHKRQVLSILHIRACQTASEIITLLENGFSDGAYARWRTLYEISVVAFVIDHFGDEVARRYLAHDAVGMRDYVVNEYRHHGREYEREALKGDERDIEDDFQAVIAEFGRHFSTPYGWAASALESKSPRFQDLEKAVNWKALTPDYKLSSYKVHAGVAGTIRSFSGLGDQPLIFGGATNAGLERAAVNTAYSLLHVTSLIFHRIKDVETQINMKATVLLRDMVQKECFKIAKNLQKEEMDLQRQLEANKLS